MSETDAAARAFAAAEAEIERVIAAKLTGFNFNRKPFRALRDIPAQISEVVGLHYVNLSNTQVADIAPLAAISGLRTLDLSASQVANLAPLAEITGLQSLSLNNTQVADIEPLAGISELRVLQLGNTRVADINPLAGIAGLQSLSLNTTQVTDIAPLAGITGLQILYLDNTQVTDIAPLAGITGLQHLSLNNTQVTDIAPLAGMAGLQILDLNNSHLADPRSLAKLQSSAGGRNPSPIFDLRFMNTPATEMDPELRRLAAVENVRKRIAETLAYLRTLPPLPEPLPWQAPERVPDAIPQAPEPDALPHVVLESEGLDIAPASATEADLADPIKQRLYPKLIEAVAALHRFGNRYPQINAPAEALTQMLRAPFAEADVLMIHLEIMALTDLQTEQSALTEGERLEPEALSALNAVLRVGPPITVGHPDIDALEDRLSTYARDRQAATVSEGERIVAGDLSEAPEIAKAPLRAVSARVSEAGDVGRVPEFRRSLHRNVIIGLATAAGMIGDAAVGYVSGEVTLAAAQFLWLHRDAIMATAPSWGQGGYVWLEFILLRAQQIVDEAAQS